MGVDKFALFLELHFPSAILPASAATSNRAVNNAFVRGARAGNRVVVDAMTHLHAIGARMSFKNRAVDQAKQRTNDLLLKNHVTGDEFAEHFFSAFKSYFWQFKASHDLHDTPLAVLIFDKAEYVNPAKRAVQSVRSHQSFRRVGEPYPETARVESDGIRLRPDSPRVESIDIERLLHSRAIRFSFQRFLMDSLTHVSRTGASSGWPANTRIIVDCEEGVFLWRAHPWTGHLMRCDADSVAMTEENRAWLVDMSPFRNRLGEADLAAVFWTTALLRHRPTTGVRIISTDTDHAMLHTYHFWDALRAKTHTVVWDNDKTVQLHLAPFATALAHLGYQRDTLICVGILSKCDYFEKNWATAQVGHQDLYVGVKNYMNKRKSLGSIAQLQCFRELLWHIYAVKLKVAPNKQALLNAGRVPKNMTMLLGDQELCRPYVQFKLAYAYFTAFRCYVPRADVLDKAASGQYDAEILVASLQTTDQ